MEEIKLIKVTIRYETSGIIMAAKVIYQSCKCN